MRKAAFFALVLLVFVSQGCSKRGRVEEIRRFPADSLEGVISRTGVSVDSEVSSEGNGSLRLDAGGSTTFLLYEVSGVAVDEARLIYRARMRTENVIGSAYLEMICVMPGEGEYFSRALQSSLSGTVDWTTVETPFFLQKGQTPEMVKLNVVVEGSGTVWIDDVGLLKGPLK
ncbi:MAG: hypothetical protein AB1742_13165 [bacterium]